MALYDENILKNPFYSALEKQRPDLCSRVAELHGIVSPSVSVCLSVRLSAFREDSHPVYFSLVKEFSFCFLQCCHVLSQVYDQ